MAVDVNKSIEEIEVSLTTSGVEKTERQLKKLSKAEKLVADSSAKVTKNVEKLSKKQKKILAKQAKDKIKANRKAEREEKRHAERMQRLAEDEELKKQPMKVRTMDQVGTPIRKSKAQREFERKLELTRVKNIKKPIKDNANISPVVSKIMKHQTTGTVELGPKNQAKALRFWEKMKKGVDDYGKSFKIIEKKTEKFVDTDEKAGKAVTNNRKKEEKKRKNAGVFPYGKENTTLSALILRMGGALGIGMMLAGIAQRAIESVSTGVVAIGDAQEKKRKNQAFINNYQNSDYNSAVNTYSQLSGTNKYNSRDVMTQALQQLQGDNVKLRSGGAVDLAKVIKGLQQYNGLDEEHATQSAVGLISGNTSLSTMNMSKVRKSDDPNVTLKNILKFLDKNVGQDSDQSIQSMINQMKTGPQGLGRYLMDVHEQQFTDIVSTISNFVHDTFDFDNENVKKAWSSALTNVQNDVQTLFGGKSGTTFSEGLAYVFATFVDGLTLGAIWMEVLYYRIKEFTGFLGQHKWAKMAVEFGIGITVFNEVIKVVGGLLKPITNFGSALIWIGKKFGWIKSGGKVVKGAEEAVEGAEAVAKTGGALSLSSLAGLAGEVFLPVVVGGAVVYGLYRANKALSKKRDTKFQKQLDINNERIPNYDKTVKPELKASTSSAQKYMDRNLPNIDKAGYVPTTSTASININAPMNFYGVDDPMSVVRAISGGSSQNQTGTKLN